MQIMVLPQVSALFLPYLGVITLWLSYRTLRSVASQPAQRKVSRAVEGPTALVVAALPVLLYWDVLHSWWLHDDPSILRHVLEYPVLASFYDPLVWRAYSPANFTPLLPLSFWLDLTAFGLEPMYFYAHQLFALAAAAATGYWLLTRFLAPAFALFVVVLVVGSPATAELAESLMTRHYVEGLVALLVAFIAFLRGIQTGRPHWLWLSAACYLIASLGKEVFVPAILLFPLLLPVRQIPWLWQQLIPFTLSVGLYALWRAWMLGTANTFAGYGELHQAAAAGHWFERGAGLLAQMGLDSSSKLALALVFCIFTFWSLGWHREHRTLALLLVGLMGACAPLIPLFPNISSRSLLMPTIWLSIVAGLGLQRLTVPWVRRNRVRPLMAPVAAAGLTFFAGVGAAGWEPSVDAARARAEWLFIMRGDPAATLVMPLGQPWYYTSLKWLRAHHGDGSAGPAVCYDECLCATSLEREYYRFDSGRLQPRRPDLRACPAMVDTPMGVALRYDSKSGVLQWELSSERDGRWCYARAPMFKCSPIPPLGSTPYFLKQAVRLQFFFHSNAGWTTSSPVLTLDPASIGPDGFLRLAWSQGL